MSIVDYFGDWYKVIDLKEVQKVAESLGKASEKAFKGFHLCPYNDLRVVMLTDSCQIFKHPYLDILKESIISLEVPHNHINFDTSLEKWCRQGVLPVYWKLQSEHGKEICYPLWNSFIKSLLSNLSRCHTAIVYLLIGSEIQSLRTHINECLNHVLSVPYIKPEHSAMLKLRNMWNQTDELLHAINGYSVQWYEECI